MQRVFAVFSITEAKTAFSSSWKKNITRTSNNAKAVQHQTTIQAASKRSGIAAYKARQVMKFQEGDGVPAGSFAYMKSLKKKTTYTLAIFNIHI